MIFAMCCVFAENAAMVRGPVFCVENTSETMRSPTIRLDDHERVHHVVLFVFENVAVPHILGALHAVLGL